MRTEDFNYELPEEFIAQRPVRPRDASRLLVLDRGTGELTHSHFHRLPTLLDSGDTLILNRTRVLPARLAATKSPSGGKAEVLLLRRLKDGEWIAMVGGKGLRKGVRLRFAEGLHAVIVDEHEGPRRRLRFDGPLEARLDELGKMPLPPYITEPLGDPEEYQTVFSERLGSAAAPTAGLHFTPDLLEELKSKGIEIVYLTLHVGMDTFAPVRAEDPCDHPIHSEWCQLSAAAARKLEAARATGGRLVAVGTTSVRTLETAVRQGTGGVIGAYSGPTDLYILPGFEFKAVDALITNFHLPRSTLLMLVSAFVGREQVLEAYEVAKEEGYRFYSFGDAMLIL